MVHNPPYEDWDLTLSVGNTLAFEACLRTLCNRGDSIIMEEYAYTSSIFATRYPSKLPNHSSFPSLPPYSVVCSFCGDLNWMQSNDRPQGIKIVGIGMDGQGMRPDLLDQRLSNWDEKEGKKPQVAYIVPYSLFP
jgi:aromatic amino acid aminotransferase I / 2-aminoadipate transaminase